MINFRNIVIYFLLCFFLFSCIVIKTDKHTGKSRICIGLPIKKNVEDNSRIIIRTKEVTKEYTGWWVYGEGHHIFKDEESLEEWNLIFPNENMEELVELYLSITHMEYFPMECKMIGEKERNILKKETKLIVSDFEILYIQGCGEE